MDLGEQLTEIGIARSRKGADLRWLTEIYKCGVQVARQRPELTSNDIRNLHEAIGKHSTPNWSALGGIMRDLEKAGVIKSTGRTVRSTRASHHGRPLRIWKSCLI